MTSRLRHLLICAAVAALVAPAAAGASASQVVQDCAADGSVDGNYSDAEKRAALKQIPADLDEYSDCRAVITASIGGGPKAKASKKGGGGGAAAGPVAAKAAKLEQARKRRERRRKVAQRRKRTEAALGNRNTDPRNPGVFRAADTSNGLPLPVLLALIALALLAIAGAVVTLGKRSNGVSSVLRRVPLLFSRR